MKNPSDVLSNRPCGKMKHATVNWKDSTGADHSSSADLVAKVGYDSTLSAPPANAGHSESDDGSGNMIPGGSDCGENQICVPDSEGAEQGICKIPIPDNCIGWQSAPPEDE